MQTQKGSTAMMVAIAVVVGVVVALGGLVYVKNNKSAETATTADAAPSAMMAAPTTDTKAADLRVMLNALQRQHVDLATIATRDGFSGNPEFKASADALDANSVQLADAVGSVYGDQAKTQFLQLWRRHIDDFVKYTVAAKKGDKAGMDAAVADLQAYIDDASTFFSNANPNLPKDAVTKLLTEHITLLKGAVDAYAKGDYAGSFDQQNQAYNQIGKISDALSGAIVKQYPDKFK